jgi:hypothetical protein
MVDEDGGVWRGGGDGEGWDGIQVEVLSSDCEVVTSARLSISRSAALSETRHGHTGKLFFRRLK